MSWIYDWLIPCVVAFSISGVITYRNHKRRLAEWNEQLARLRRCGLIVALLAFAPASAQADWKPALAVAIGQSLDIASTIRFSQKYPPGHWKMDGSCHEDTEFFRAPDGGYRQARASLVAVGLVGASLGLDALTKSKPRMRRLAHWLSYGIGAVGVVQAAKNVSNCGW